LIGAHVRTAPRLPNCANRWTEEANRTLALRLLAERHVDVDSLVSHREPPQRAPELFAVLADRRVEAMGVVPDWRESR
jgi:threonine dehydrogenase-like Zn-dependent dehydrogenase